MKVFILLKILEPIHAIKQFNEPFQMRVENIKTDERIIAVRNVEEKFILRKHYISSPLVEMPLTKCSLHTKYVTFSSPVILL
jgi:hypothetical protein